MERRGNRSRFPVRYTVPLQLESNSNSMIYMANVEIRSIETTKKTQNCTNPLWHKIKYFLDFIFLDFGAQKISSSSLLNVFLDFVNNLYKNKNNVFKDFFAPKSLHHLYFFGFWHENLFFDLQKYFDSIETTKKTQICTKPIIRETKDDRLSHASRIALEDTDPNRRSVCRRSDGLKLSSSWVLRCIRIQRFRT